jgi:uncharacterized protein (DUF1697 family)
MLTSRVDNGNYWSSGSAIMPKYVALLRAINVGGHTVKMEYLRGLFEASGFANVETFIASGNVIFESGSGNPRALERKIEKHLREALGYEVKTFVRAIPELAAVAAYKPFSDSELNKEGNTLFIGFVADSPADEAKRKLLSCSGELDDLHVQGREIYWLYRTRMMSDSKFSGALLEKILGMRATFRNSTTVRKIAAKYS